MLIYIQKNKTSCFIIQNLRLHMVSCMAQYTENNQQDNQSNILENTTIFAYQCCRERFDTLMSYNSLLYCEIRIKKFVNPFFHQEIPSMLNLFIIMIFYQFILPSQREETLQAGYMISYPLTIFFIIHDCSCTPYAKPPI